MRGSRWLMALAAVCLSAGSVHARIIGPDAFGYSATNEIAFAFQDISTTGTRVFAGSDDTATSTALGFTFNFYGTNYGSVGFNSNGLMTFGGTTSAFSNVDFSTSPPAGNLRSIAVLWDDWQFYQAGADAVYFQSQGAAGSRQFIVQWNLAHGYSSSPSGVTFQAVLYEGSNNILLSYRDVDAGNSRSFGGNATVGIANSNGYSSGEYLQWSYNSPEISNSESILFTTSNLMEPVPEPSTLVIFGFGAGLAGFVSARRRLRKARQSAAD